ncbi:IclR family transcriptional regulator [Sphingomonas metalli]|uniref:IclR family transcriptional regulator n=2 Tax=Sphingomonas metalli TaxID=1779358 RepID=A0A916WZH2_9SPHN|nr:IclR family transcriptional regulator [Sphingomonas metalli]
MGRAALKGTYAAPAIQKAFEVIELLAARPEGAIISDMAASLGRSVGELFRIVVVLEQLGYLQKSEITDRYTVAYKLLEVAYRATPSHDLVGAALPEMQVLALEAGQSCHLVVAGSGHGLVIAREEQPGTRGFSLKVGARIDMVRSCSGQVILAFSTLQRVEQIVRDIEEDGDAAPVDRDALAKRMAAVRRNGFEMRKSPITYGVTDISFPIFGFDRNVVAALTIPFLELIDGSQKVDLEAARDLLARTAARVSDRLGYRPA